MDVKPLREFRVRRHRDPEQDTGHAWVISRINEDGQDYTEISRLATFDEVLDDLDYLA